MKFLLNGALLGVLWSATGLATAADAPAAVVNGVAITARWVDRHVQAQVAQGQKDTLELRAALKQELVARELMSQEAQKRGLDQLPTTQDALTAMRQNLMIELLLIFQRRRLHIGPLKLNKLVYK